MFPSSSRSQLCYVPQMDNGLDTRRTVDELRELQTLTGDASGAQRLCWTDTWLQAREWLATKLARLPVQAEIDPAGNQWATLPGRSPRTLLIGGHLDSVTDGGWLDGCLNVLAGLEVLRHLAAQSAPPLTVRLVSWADEEGARFGRSLFGSSAAAGHLEPDEVPCPTRSRPATSTSTGPAMRGSSSPTRPPTSSFTSSRARCWSASACRWARCSARTPSNATC